MKNVINELFKIAAIAEKVKPQPDLSKLVSELFRLVPKEYKVMLDYKLRLFSLTLRDEMKMKTWEDLSPYTQTALWDLFDTLFTKPFESIAEMLEKIKKWKKKEVPVKPEVVPERVLEKVTYELFKIAELIE